MASTLSSSSFSASSLQSSSYNAGLRRLSIRPPSLLTFRSPRPGPFNVKALSAPTLTQDDLKKLAADKAVEYVRSGMVHGLGTGSTAAFVVSKLGELLKSSQLTDIVEVPPRRGRRSRHGGWGFLSRSSMTTPSSIWPLMGPMRWTQTSTWSRGGAAHF
ncbi:hypothetical protein SAY87_022499 [Trapa incisa]|uniref:Ribose-5-phosphate isomerase n=1 Tax=Trapa incisa TaxID=236973 RepID=A0AAN7K7W7_9MYRT|nr:hypothetical protein SAY87_022499 [Trapa incisa]